MIYDKNLDAYIISYREVKQLGKSIEDIALEKTNMIYICQNAALRAFEIYSDEMKWKQQE